MRGLRAVAAVLGCVGLAGCKGEDQKLREEMAGLRAEVAKLNETLSKVNPPDALRGVTEQSGDLSTATGTGTFQQFYPRPFASPPELTFPDLTNKRLNFQVTEQRADGFTYHVSGYTPGLPPPPWKAKGLLALERK